MKKLFLVAAAAAFMASAAQAQDVYKQTGGESNLEFLFTPLGGSPIGINGIKYRKFTSATTALRATVFVGFNSSNDKFNGFDSTGDEVELSDKMSGFDITIAPGYEMHFAGTDRLSPYVGAEVLIGFSNSKEVSESIPEGSDDISTMTETNGSFTGGLNALAGMDYYFAHDIYIGAELGFGFAFTSDFETKTEVEFDGNTNEGTEPGGSSFNIGPNVVGSLRVGFLF
jgi:opacity protein-like surface antigen